MHYTTLARSSSGVNLYTTAPSDAHRKLARVVRHPVTQRPFPDELPRLLQARKLTLRALAREVGGLDHSYLSRMLSRRTAVNVQHAERIARHLGLPSDYFPEVREAAVIEATRRHPRLRDEIYFERIKKRRR